MNKIFTIGYERADLADFVATLRSAGIRQLIDIRELPQSRRRGFSKNLLASELSESGIEYLHLKALGDPKHGRDAARAGRMDEFKQIFTAHMERPEALDALKIAAKAARSMPSVLLCYERDPKHCHRSIVANKLNVLYTFQVEHLGVIEGGAKQFERTEQRVQ